VEEEKYDKDPMKENQLVEQVQEVTINYINYMEAVVQ
jgi:hypothetical protein